MRLVGAFVGGTMGAGFFSGSWMILSVSGAPASAFVASGVLTSSGSVGKVLITGGVGSASSVTPASSLVVSEGVVSVVGSEVSSVVGATAARWRGGAVGSG